MNKIKIVERLQKILEGASWATKEECLEAWKKIIDLEYELNERRQQMEH